MSSVKHRYNEISRRRDRSSRSCRLGLKLKSRMPLMEVCLLITMLLTTSTSAHKLNSHRKEAAASDAGNQRSIMLGKFLLAGILGILGILGSFGLKLLAFLPIVVSKLLLLTTLSFLSSNLSLLISVFVGARHLLLHQEKANVNGHDDREYLHRDQVMPERAAEHGTQEDPGSKTHAVNSLASRLDRGSISSKYAEWRRRYLRRAIDSGKKLLTGEGFAAPVPSGRNPLIGRRKIELGYRNGRYASFL